MPSHPSSTLDLIDFAAGTKPEGVEHVQLGLVEVEGRSEVDPQPSSILIVEVDPTTVTHSPGRL